MPNRDSIDLSLGDDEFEEEAAQLGVEFIHQVWQRQLRAVNGPDMIETAPAVWTLIQRGHSNRRASNAYLYRSEDEAIEAAAEAVVAYVGEEWAREMFEQGRYKEMLARYESRDDRLVMRVVPAFLQIDDE